jgi:hypothetical protein
LLLSAIMAAALTLAVAAPSRATRWAGSAEVRVPLSPVLSDGKLGVSGGLTF